MRSFLFVSLLLFGCFIFHLSSVTYGSTGLYHLNQWIKISKDRDDGIYVFDWRLKVSIKQCVEACKATKACQFVNLESRSHLCALIRSDKEFTPVIEEKPGYILGVKSEWMEEGDGACENCASNGYCNNDKSQNTENVVCGNSGCVHPRNAEVNGNMFSSGNTIRLKCKDDFQKFPLRMQDDRLTCAENGTWHPIMVCLPRITFGGSHYSKVTKSMTWYKAKANCESLHGHLVDINSSAEQQFIESVINSDAFKEPVWLGGNDLEKEGVWRWSDNSEINQFTNWIPGNPDNYAHSRHCLHAVQRSAGWLWNDRDCTSTLPSICEFR